MTETYTISEINAYRILQKVEGWGMCTDEKRDAHDAGNEIIELAERIKAERAVAGMACYL